MHFSSVLYEHYERKKEKMCRNLQSESGECPNKQEIQKTVLIFGTVAWIPPSVIEGWLAPLIQTHPKQ